MNKCSMCHQNIEEVNDIFNAVKKDVPEDKRNIFDNYYAKKEPKRDICISCYIRTTLMIQRLSSVSGN